MGTPVRVVVCGGIGAGKSTVGRLLAERGAVVLDADRIGHEVIGRGGEAYAEVAARWPEAVVEGVIDRSRLAAIVFADLDELAALEAIVHPHIRRRIRAIAADAGDLPVVVEMPVIRQLIGPGWITVFIDAPDDLRIRRATARGADRADVEARMRAQSERAAWVAEVDHVVENDGDVNGLRRRVGDLWDRLIAEAEAD